MVTTVRRVQSCGSVPARSAVTARAADTSTAPSSALGEPANSSGSRFIGTTADLRRGSLLADRIYELDEPWRTRFVELIAQRVDAHVLGRRLPSREQLILWLSDLQLARLVELMLRTWACEDR